MIRDPEIIKRCALRLWLPAFAGTETDGVHPCQILDHVGDDQRGIASPARKISAILRGFGLTDGGEDGQHFLHLADLGLGVLAAKMGGEFGGVESDVEVTFGAVGDERSSSQA